MKALDVRALPRGWDADHVRFSGEPIFCDFMDYVDDPRFDSTLCAGRSEIEITFRTKKESFTLRLCRQHATDVAHQIEEAVALVDGRDLMEMGKERGEQGTA